MILGMAQMSHRWATSEGCQEVLHQVTQLVRGTFIAVQPKQG